MEPGHAEVEQVWPRDGHVRVIGHIAGGGTSPATSTGTLILTDRDRPAVTLNCPATLTGTRFEASFDIDLITSTSPLAGSRSRRIWDLHLTVPGCPQPLRVGRHLDDIPNKKKVMTFPTQTRNTPAGAVSVKPYYTVQANLSLICRRAAK
ncbi:hypothetical protein [Microbispora rosea]|uniref:hypothetical protein n=1 Tax=Microbispora rosea TaxID=58117 RepID=UPI0004C3462E|nr:hypothetical protein [Microbispora rosea]